MSVTYMALKAVISLAIILFLNVLPTIAADFSGEVVGVLDSDTLEVPHTQHPERIHLSGVDCPEKNQALGKRAKHAASALVYGKAVALQMNYS